MKVVTVVGARPQFVKAAVLRRLFQENNIKEVLVHTGQHYSDNMDRVFFQELGLAEPDYRFDVNNAGHGRMVGRMVEAVSTVLADEMPDWVLVYGDTNTSLAGALAAKILGLKLAWTSLTNHGGATSTPSSTSSWTSSMDQGIRHCFV